jgi:hypothetical protein
MNWPLAFHDRFTRDQVETTRGAVGSRSSGLNSDAGLGDLLAASDVAPDDSLPPGPAAVLVTFLSAGLWLLITVGCVALIG